MISLEPDMSTYTGASSAMDLSFSMIIVVSVTEGGEIQPCLETCSFYASREGGLARIYVH